MAQLGCNFICVGDDFSCVHVGYTKRSIQSVWKRFADVYGNTRILVFKSDKCREIDKEFHKTFTLSRNSCRLYNKDELDAYKSFIQSHDSVLPGFYTYYSPSMWMWTSS